MNKNYILKLNYIDEGDTIQEEMSIDFTTHSIVRLNRIRENIGNLDDLHKRILFLLEQIPQFLLEEIRIGETFACFDLFTNLSFALQMCENKLKVITVFDENPSIKRTIKLFAGEKVVMFSATEISYGVFLKSEKRIVTDL